MHIAFSNSNALFGYHQLAVKIVTYLLKALADLKFII